MSRYWNRKKRKRWERQPENLDKHHVPPTSNCKDFKKQYILLKPHTPHVAYHILFGNAGSYEECCKILKERWWTPQ